MVTDAMFEAIQIFNEMQGGSSADINVLSFGFLEDLDKDEWNEFTEDEKKTLINDYTKKLYF